MQDCIGSVNLLKFVGTCLQHDHFSESGPTPQRLANTNKICLLGSSRSKERPHSSIWLHALEESMLRTSEVRNVVLLVGHAETSVTSAPNLGARRGSELMLVAEEACGVAPRKGCGNAC
eukprot:570591-Amphidinium_carterae.1